VLKPRCILRARSRPPRELPLVHPSRLPPRPPDTSATARLSPQNVSLFPHLTSVSTSTIAWLFFTNRLQLAGLCIYFLLIFLFLIAASSNSTATALTSKGLRRILTVLIYDSSRHFNMADENFEEDIFDDL
jgi:hypothetical protein